jgi:hypothetical protein
MENCAYTSLNFLLADGGFLYAFRLPGTEGLYVRRLEAEEDFRGQSSYGTRTESRHSHGAIYTLWKLTSPRESEANPEADEHATSQPLKSCRETRVPVQPVANDT